VLCPTDTSDQRAHVRAFRCWLTPERSPIRQSIPRLLVAALLIALGACTPRSTLSVGADTGSTPRLLPPDESLIPVVDIAPATGWPADARPTPAAGLAVNAFATGLDHPRWLYVLPNGDVLVAETNAPPDSGAVKGIKGAVMKSVMKKAGAGVPSANRITLLRDANRDGVAEINGVFLSGLNSPFGMTLVGDTLYVANADSLLQFPYRDGDLRIEAPGRKLTDLPHGPGPLNHHWTKSLIASADGTRLYVGVGSNSNIGDVGMDKETDRAAIWEIDRATGSKRVFANGLRNPVGLAWQPDSGVLWAVVNERDELGNDLVPDYLSAIEEGAFYGWPYSYFGSNLDPRVQPQRSDLVATARVPDYALGAHVAPLGLTFNTGTTLPAQFANGAFIGEHGSWNRKPPSGYEVVFVAFADGQPSGPPVTVLSGFLGPKGEARGRPVGVVIDAAGALLVADDVGNIVWRVSAENRSP